MGQPSTADRPTVASRGITKSSTKVREWADCLRSPEVGDRSTLTVLLEEWVEKNGSNVLNIGSECILTEQSANKQPGGQ